MYYFVMFKGWKYFFVGKMEGLVGILEHLVGEVFIDIYQLIGTVAATSAGIA